ncbi:MAG: hypothetical protein AAGI48_14550 [Verrucomicrobiota bacterium]
MRTILFPLLLVFAITASADLEKETKLKLNWVMDTETSMPVYGFHTPANWEFDGQVQWNLANTTVPVVIGSMAGDPKKGERIHFMPDVVCYWLTGDASINPGGMNLGMINLAPMPAEAALVEAVTKLFRADVKDFQITGVRQLPGLAVALKQPATAGHGVGLRAEYTLNGIEVEEEVYGLYSKNAATLRGEAGVTTQTTWGLHSLHGFTVPRGTMEKRRSFFTYMVRSIQINPAWVQFHAGVKQQLEADFARAIAQNRAERERIMAQSRALAARNEAFRANIMARHRAAMDTGNHDRFIAGIDESTSHDRFIDSIHDVETFKDPQFGTSQHGYAKQHWTDGWGSYIQSDDVNFDPNIGSQIEWKPMERAR